MSASSSQAQSAIDLGTADSFAVLGASGVTNTGPTVVNGDLGTSPTPSVTGFTGPPNGTVNGVIHQADAVAAQAQAATTTAYNNAAGQGPTTVLATELGGQTLTPGVYNSASGTFGITGTVTLDAQSNPDAVFIFKTASTLISASSSRVNLINGAQSCHVYWQIGSSATLGAGSTFLGNIMAQQTITVGNGVAVDGRLLARTGAVTMINDTITRAQCAPDGGGGTPGGGGGTPGGGGGNTGGGGGGNPGGGGGNPGGGNPGSGPNVSIPNVPGGGFGKRCTDDGFRARFNIHSKAGVRTARVYLDGKLIKRSGNRKFSVWIDITGLRAGKNTLRLVAVDNDGNRSETRKSFRYCAKAAPEPDFTGRTLWG